MPLDIFFNIILVSVSFLQTYYDIYSFHILSFSFYLLQISFYICFLLTLLVFLDYFHNNLLLYLVLLLFFFFLIINCVIHFLYIAKKNIYKNSQARINHYVNCIIFTRIPKVNSVRIHFYINNINIIKPLQGCGLYLKPNNDKFHIFWRIPFINIYSVVF